MSVLVNSKNNGALRRRGAPGLLTLLVVVLTVGVLRQPGVRAYQGIPGNFCRNRQPSECCEDRFDDCSVPLLDTYCYCDEFCISDSGNAKDDDCCPDFREVCLGEKPQHDDPEPLVRDCERDGVRIPSGSSHLFDCNECKCEGGQLACEDDKCMVDREVMDTVNHDITRYGWRATNYTCFMGWKARDGLRLRTGTFKPEPSAMNMVPINLHPDLPKIPRQFNAAKKVEWHGRLSEVSDQGWCGASWAFSTIGVTQDRQAIVAQGMKPVQLSVQNLLSCANLGQRGCEGGHIERAWNYLRRIGVVLEECLRYESGTSGKMPRCLIPGRDTSGLQCEHKHQYKMEPAYRISSKVTDIQWEIMMNGPVQALMEVGRDFFMYRSGVYRCSELSGGQMATHSVRIIGWGEAPLLGSRPIQYWLVANSWGTGWGERGYFRIRRGTNECGIESFILAARGRLANMMYGKGS